VKEFVRVGFNHRENRLHAFKLVSSSATEILDLVEKEEPYPISVRFDEFQSRYSHFSLCTLA